MTKRIIDTSELLGFRLVGNDQDLAVRAGAKVGSSKQVPPPDPVPRAAG